jgi:hypothetical protein
LAPLSSLYLVPFCHVDFLDELVFLGLQDLLGVLDAHVYGGG